MEYIIVIFSTLLVVGVCWTISKLWQSKFSAPLSPLSDEDRLMFLARRAVDFGRHAAKLEIIPPGQVLPLAQEYIVSLAPLLLYGPTLPTTPQLHQAVVDEFEKGF